MKKLLTALCGTISAVALFAIMALTLVDVSGRKLFSHSLPGSLEVTELLLVAVIFAGLPLVSLRQEHIVFDSLDPLLPPWLRRVQQFVVEALCAVALAGIAWLMWVKGAQLGEYGETTAQLKMGLAPFVHGMSLLCAVTALVHAMLMLQTLTHKHPGLDDGQT